MIMLREVRLLDPPSRTDAVKDILIAERKIIKIGEKLELDCPEKVVTDGKFITARGAGAASDFGFEIVTLLKGAQTAQELKKQMQYL